MGLSNSKNLITNKLKNSKTQKLNRMKIVNKILSKIGTDKALHFLVGALLTAWASMVNDVCMWVTAVLVVIASIGKEGLDDKYDIKDIIAGCVGCVVSIVMFYLT